ncbi:MAG: DUF2029 domain-containing protein [Planctomycetes bacterium]|nr:DUF2029 domain-containing protein [Planctomycetota bacterium]
MNLRTILTFGVLVIVVVLTGEQLRELYDDTSLLRPYDYMEYWSAGRATLRGQNPYDGDVLYPLQQEMGTRYKDPVMMWNPPWTLPAAMIIGSLPWRMGQMIWFALNLVAVLVSAALLWRLSGGDRRLTWLSVVVASLFAPTTFLLLLGQISGFMLFGLVGFLWAVKSERFVLAGALAALTAIKPHLLVGFAIVLVLQSLRGNAVWKSVLSGGAVLVVFGLIPLAWNPAVWSLYREGTSVANTRSHPTLHNWEHPTLGYEIRQALPNHPFAAMFIPLAIAVPVVVGYWWLRRRDWNWLPELPRLILVSLLAAPYGAWGFDLVLLLVPVVQATTWLVADGRRLLWGVVGSVYLALNLLAISTITREGSMTNPWIVPVTFAGYLLVGWRTKISPPAQL